MKPTYKIRRGQIGALLNIIVFLALVAVPVILFVLGYAISGIAIVLLYSLLNFISLYRVWSYKRSDLRTKINWSIFLVIPGTWYMYLRGGLVAPWVWKSIKESYLLENGLKLSSTKETNIEVFETPVNHFDKMIEDLKTAKEFINIQYFIINDGIIWSQIKPILLQKKKEGVEINILIDYVGNVQTLDSSYQDLIDNDIPVVQFNKVRFWKVTGKGNFRSHNKFVIIDNKIGWFGGTNIGDDYASLYSKYGYWSDLHIRAEGELVYEFNSQFIAQWFLETNEIITQKPIVKADSFIDVQIKSDGPQYDDPVFLNDLVEAIDNAKETVKIATPYYILPKVLDTAMKNATKRGVKIDILTTGRADKASAYLISKFYAERSTTWGVRVFRTTDFFFHSKFTVIDSKKVFVGTSNLDYRALYLHFESNLTINDEVIAAKFEEVFKTHLANSYLTTKSIKDWSLGKRIAEKLINLIATIF